MSMLMRAIRRGLCRVGLHAWYVRSALVHWCGGRQDRTCGRCGKVEKWNEWCR